MEQLEYVFVLRKLLSRWNSPTGPVSRTQPASACRAEWLGAPLRLSWPEPTVTLGTGGPRLPILLE